MIGPIEAAMIARVKAASDTGLLGYAFGDVGSFAGDIAALPEARFRMPAVWIFYSSEPRPERLMKREFKRQPVFSALVAVEATRSEYAARTGAGTEVGAYQILDDVRALLAGQTFGLDMEPLQPGRVVRLAQTDQVVFYALEFHAQFDDYSLDDISLDDFLRFHVDYDVPPTGDVSPPLPAADAEAADDVTLEGPQP